MYDVYNDNDDINDIEGFDELYDDIANYDGGGEIPLNTGLGLGGIRRNTNTDETIEGDISVDLDARLSYDIDEDESESFDSFAKTLAEDVDEDTIPDIEIEQKVKRRYRRQDRELDDFVDPDDPLAGLLDDEEDEDIERTITTTYKVNDENIDIFDKANERNSIIGNKNDEVEDKQSLDEFSKPFGGLDEITTLNRRQEEDAYIESLDAPVYVPVEYQGGIESFPTEDPREDGSGFMGKTEYDNDLDNVTSRIYRAEVTNFMADLVMPMSNLLLDLAELKELQDKTNFGQVTSMQANMLRAMYDTSEESTGSFLHGIKGQYELFMRNPAWNALVGLNRYLVSPMFSAATSVLFGRSKDNDVQKKILKAIQEQTEFQMKGEIEGRGFFDKLKDRGVVGTAGSLLGGVLLDSVGISKSEGQRREDKRARGEQVNWSPTGWLSDMYSKGDITRRGRHGLGTIEEGRYESNTEKVRNWVTDLKFLDPLKKETGLSTDTSTKVHQGEFIPKSDGIESASIESPELNIDEVSLLDIANVRTMMFGGTMSITPNVMNDLSEQMKDTLFSMSESNIINTPEFTHLMSNDNSSTNQAMNRMLSTLNNNGIVITDHDVRENSSIHNTVLPNQYNENNQRSLSLNSTQTETSGVDVLSGQNNTQSTTSNIGESAFSFGNIFNTTNKEDGQVDPLQNIVSDDGMTVESPVLNESISKTNEIQNIHNRKEMEQWDDNTTTMDVIMGILNAIKSSTKTTAKETTKVRRQGFMRMLLSAGGILVNGIGTMIKGIGSVVSTIAAWGGSIVAAVAAGAWGRYRRGRGTPKTTPRPTTANRKAPRPTSTPKTSTTPRTPSGGLFGGLRDRASNAYQGVKNVGAKGLGYAKEKAGGFIKGADKGTSSKVGKIGGGLVTAALAVPEALSIINDEDSTTTEKLRDGTGLGGSVAGGLVGAKAGAAAGAAIGSIIPIGGTAVGGIIGGLAGGIGGAFLGRKAGDTAGSVFTLGRSKEEDEAYHAQKEKERIEKEQKGSFIGNLFGFGKDDKEKDTITPSTKSPVIPKSNFGGKPLETNTPNFANKFPEPKTPDNLVVNGSANSVNNSESNSVISSNNVSDGNDSFINRALNMVGDAKSDNTTSENFANSRSSLQLAQPEPVKIDLGSKSNGNVEESNGLTKLGSTLTTSIKSLGDRFDGFFAQNETNFEAINVKETQKNTLEVQRVISEKTTEANESSEVGNGHLKTIEKTLSDMLRLQKSQMVQDQPDDNSGILSSMSNYLRG